MKIIFTKHSLEQIQRRNISKALVKKTVLNFVVVDSVNFENINKIITKISESKLLIIICIFTTNECRIITAYLTSKVKKYLTE